MAGTHRAPAEPGGLLQQACVLREPQHLWTREEQVRLGAKFSAPLSEPGTRFSYSDTGYILLGDIIERIITDRQKWRWDAVAKRWWLVSGLPDLDAR